MPASTPVLLAEFELNTPHDIAAIPVGADVPGGTTVFVNLNIGPTPPSSISVSDHGGNVYGPELNDNNVRLLFRSYITTPLSSGDEITLEYDTAVGLTAATIWYVEGLVDADAVDSDVRSGNPPNPLTQVVVPGSGIAVAAVYFGATADQSGYGQDSNFTDIGSAEADDGVGVRRIDSSFRLDGGTYTYDPALGDGFHGISIAAFAGSGILDVTKAGRLAPRQGGALDVTKVGRLVPIPIPTSQLGLIRTRGVELWVGATPGAIDRVAVLSTNESILSGTYRFQLDRDEMLEMVVPEDASGLELVELGEILRVNDGVHPASWWRISGKEEGRGIGTGTVTITAHSLHADLARALLKISEPGGSTLLGVQGTRTVAEWIEDIIIPALHEEALTYIVADANAFADVELTFQAPNITALGLMNRIETETGGEWRLEDNGGGVFGLSLYALLNEDGPLRLVSFGRNLLRLDQTTEHGQLYGTVVVPTGRISPVTGFAATIADAVWVVSAVSDPMGIGNFIHVQDPNGGDGPAQFDDQFSPPYASIPTHWLRTAGRADSPIVPPESRDILSTQVLSPQTTRLVLDDLSDIEVGDLVSIREVELEA